MGCSRPQVFDAIDWLSSLPHGPGITSILHPSDPNFNETEYAAHGVEETGVEELV